MDFYMRPMVSHEVEERILYYYQELYNNYEMKTVPEMAEELGVSASTIYKFLNANCATFNDVKEYPLTLVMIMTCTKFGNKSHYYFEQKEKFSEIIKKRDMIKNIKMRTAKLNEKRKTKGL